MHVKWRLDLLYKRVLKKNKIILMVYYNYYNGISFGDIDSSSKTVFEYRLSFETIQYMRKKFYFNEYINDNF